MMIELVIDYALAKNRRVANTVKVIYYGANFFAILYQMFSLASSPPFGQMLAESLLPVTQAQVFHFMLFFAINSEKYVTWENMLD